MKQTETAPPSCCLRKTPFGPVAVLWSVYRGRPRIQRILLTGSGVPAGRQIGAFGSGSAAPSCREIDGIADRIVAFLSGEDIRFSLDGIRLDLCFRFQQKVLRAEHGIPRGGISTYQRIAGHIGAPGGARAVGAALASNPFPIIIPCHRAIRSDGTPGSYQGGPEMKRSLLEMEGIVFSASGRVISGVMFY